MLLPSGLAATRRGGTRVAGFGSAKCSNEEAYLFQKMIRQGFGHNNVDHCTRLVPRVVGRGADGKRRLGGGDGDV